MKKQPELAELLLPSSPSLKLLEIISEKTQITLNVITISPYGECPKCHAFSQREHSLYERTVKDLPVSGTPVVMKLTVRRFFCDNDACGRKTFTEQISPVLERYARKTNRLIETQRSIAFQSGGEPGSRISQTAAVSTSPDSLIRLCRRQPIATPKNSPAFLGIDDWAFKKGHTYGSILVDLETHHPVDLLPDRTSETVSARLTAHPGVKLVSRDRYSGFAEAVKKSAPDAVQVADRWHLLHNLFDVVERFVAHNYGMVQTVFRETFAPTPPAPQPPDPPAPPEERKPTQYELTRQQIQTKRQVQFDEIHRLNQTGLGIRAISKQLNISREKVRKNLQNNQAPVACQRQKKKTILDPYWNYLEQRWRDGQRNGVSLYEEIRAMGYPGTYQTIAIQIRRLRETLPRRPQNKKKASSSPKAVSKLRPFSARQSAWMLICKPEKLTDEQNRYCERLVEASPNFRSLRQQVHAFWDMVRQRKREELDEWLIAANQSGIEELRNFAQSLRKDLAAVQAALEYSWSNGVVEGHNNRLKMIKRQMYGRAKFDLLRQRVLFHM